MSDKPGQTPTVPVPAATILLLRDNADGMEVFMVERHHQIDYIAGALVFPGGKAAPGDFDPELGAYMDGTAAWSPEMRALGATAIREAFEEAGILLARDAATREFIDEARLARLESYRHALEKGQIGLRKMVADENLRLACDRLVHFAHWITPDISPKRFDTHFFLALAPHGHIGRHDGRESVDSVWIAPQTAIADFKRWSIVFPTKLNLLKLAQWRTVDEALAAARAATPLTVVPWIEQRDGDRFLCIREDAGYPETSAPMQEMGISPSA